jgi:hypothetical protein
MVAVRGAWLWCSTGMLMGRHSSHSSHSRVSSFTSRAASDAASSHTGSNMLMRPGYICAPGTANTPPSLSSDCAHLLPTAAVPGGCSPCRIPKEKYFPVPGVDGALVTFKLLPPSKRLSVPGERGFIVLVGAGHSGGMKGWCGTAHCGVPCFQPG